MPTEKGKISLYVPDVIYEAFMKFKYERGLSMSGAGVEILSEYFGVGGVRGKKGQIASEARSETIARIEALEEKSEEHSRLLERLIDRW